MRHMKPQQHKKRAPNSHGWEKQKNSTSVRVLERLGSGGVVLMRTKGETQGKI